MTYFTERMSYCLEEIIETADIEVYGRCRITRYDEKKLYKLVD